MPGRWNDWLYGGGLFGGFGGYDDISSEARDRANRRGLLTTGALIMGNSVGPENMGFGRNISSALLMGRESFEDTLAREAQREAELARKQKLKELEEEKLRLAEEEKQREFDEWQMKEGMRTQWVNTIIEKTGKSFEEINALSDSSIENLYEQGLFPKEPKSSKTKIEGGRLIEVDPEGNERFLSYLPPEPKSLPTPEELDAKASATRDKWIKDYAYRLGQDKVEQPVTDADGTVKMVMRPRIATYEERLLAAEDAWEARQQPFFGVRSGGSTSSGALPAGPVTRPHAFDSQNPYSDATGPTPTDVSRAKSLVDKHGPEMARAMMVAAGGTLSEVDQLLSLAMRR